MSKQTEPQYPESTDVPSETHAAGRRRDDPAGLAANNRAAAAGSNSRRRRVPAGARQPVAEPAWLKNAVASIDPGNRPMIAHRAATTWARRRVMCRARSGCPVR